MSSELTDIQQRVLTLISKDSHRPSAITRVLVSHQFPCDQNQVIQALLELEKRGLVERFTGKTWVATSKGQSQTQ